MKKVLVVPTFTFLENRANLYSEKLKFPHFLNEHATFIDREPAEKDPTYLQIIPYTIVKNSNSIFTYTRLNKGNETRLHDKMSIGVGGHIDMPTTVYPHKYAVLEDSVERELQEELEVNINECLLARHNEYIYDPTNAVGLVHLGIIYTAFINKPTIEVREKHKIKGGFMSYKDLRAKFDQDPQLFETWSAYALNLINNEIIQ